MQNQTMSPGQAPPLGATPTPSRASQTMRSIGRITGRVLSLAVIAAAGVAGWMIVDEVAFGPVAGAVDVDQSASPWPDAFSRQTSTWDSFTLTYRENGAPTHRSSTDAATGRTRITYFDDAGAASSFAEVAGLEAWQRSVGDGEWVRADEAMTEGHLQLGLGNAQPSHVSTILPAWAEPFAVVDEQPTDGPTTRLVVSIDVAGLQAAEPVAFERWADDMAVELDGGAIWAWTLDVRDDGYIVRWEGRHDSIEAWGENPADLVFESPLQPRTTPAPVPPSTDASAED